jgi:hypothetical protein
MFCSNKKILTAYLALFLASNLIANEIPDVGAAQETPISMKADGNNDITVRPDTPPSASPISNKKVVSVSGGSSNNNSNPITPKEEMSNEELAAYPSRVTGKSDLSQASNVIDGKSSSDTKKASVAPLLANKVKEEDIDKALTQRERMESFLARRGHNDINYQDQIVHYSFKDYENRPVEIYLKKGYITQIEFLNEIEDPIRITFMSAGSKNFNVTQPASNIISFEPTKEWGSTNFQVRLDGYKGVITFKVVESKEGSETTFDNYFKMIITDGPVAKAKSLSTLKTNILRELYQHDTLRGNATSVAYDVTDGSKNATAVRYFDENDLKIYRVSKFGKDMVVVQLSNKYEMLGYQGSAFSRYKNAYNIYFLPWTTSFFRIISKQDIPTNDLSNPRNFSEDIGLGEIYRVELK